MSKNFNTAVVERRTYYGISKEAVVADDKLIEIIEHSVKHTPSAFNSQGARVVILLGEKHDRLWNITEDALRKVVPADQFASTEEKIISFRNGYGTILYFEDQSVIKGLQEQFALYKDNFPVWAQQSNGMLQFVIWTAIEAEGYGASLQHYAELIEADVRAEWNIPDNWKMIAQMPFGKPVNPPQEKVYQPLDSRVRIIQ
ncbi:MAG: hypothetical protein K0R21_2082 [Anaerocolumna sp.]|jgi:predicted oxidoreductase (fatty acid repression mutant protein)|nr:hypothetical protein [Anaerocolumna sp.]